MRIARDALMRWIPLGVAVTMLALVAYAVGQQVFRLSANDPQTAIAEDAARRIALGADPVSLVPSGTVDPSKSLSPFVMVFGPAAGLVASDVTLDGSTPVPPLGVLRASPASGENRVTWQPRADTRIAAVVVQVEGGRGYVLAGRCLRAVEERIAVLGQLVLAGWAATMLATLSVTAGVVWLEIRTPVGDRSG